MKVTAKEFVPKSKKKQETSSETEIREQQVQYSDDIKQDPQQQSIQSPEKPIHNSEQYISQLVQSTFQALFIKDTIQLPHPNPINITPREVEWPVPKDSSLFYQSTDGQRVYLDPISISIISSKCGGRMFMPSELEVTVVWEDLQRKLPKQYKDTYEDNKNDDEMDYNYYNEKPKTKQKHRNMTGMSHLPDYSGYIVAEIDIRGWSEDILSQFEDQLQKHWIRRKAELEQERKDRENAQMSEQNAFINYQNIMQQQRSSIFSDDEINGYNNLMSRARTQRYGTFNTFSEEDFPDVSVLRTDEDTK
ncbi:MAG: hypothetical protein EZS28_023811 [Streblomastix strix]|uniref:Uncharacterized protein n=2 Tax=Streblomastix strix TaxID=222440 RepID=A0A5J4VDU6_9EUKA|nr:MAG: hypothetical protein EZS28_023811 [Streblomastix strix]